MQKFDLETLRHSCAHLIAHAITRVFPSENVQLGIGPVIEYGMYYDIDMEHRLTEEDLKKIETKMKEIIKEKLPILPHTKSRQEAVDYYKSIQQPLKVELVQSIPENETISFYTQGEFTDLCRGPHVSSTGDLSVLSFKLLHVAGAYWRGDSNNKMLQRVYAACFADKQELKDYLHRLEEAKKRDHRKLGAELSLFHFDPVAPASPFFMPKGAVVYNQLVDFMRGVYHHFGYQEVITPQILDSDLWHTSGHYEHYKENMYFSQIDEREYAVKPMNCPCHMLMFRHYKYSYRDLPMRYADFGRLHRYEKAGAVAGLTRVRTFCQDDAHIFIQLSQIEEEIINLLKMFFICYEHFGFDKVKVNLSTRPEKKAGDDATWDKAENALKAALEKANHPYAVKEGDGAFYGPKIDIEISDALGRYHQLGTIQLDFQLPERFDLNFVNQDNQSERPVVIHRALLGSLERFIGVYIEHVAGAFPFWLAPEQIVIVPVNPQIHAAKAQELAKELTQMNLRVRVDERNETIGKKTREIQKAKVPFMLVIGDREIETSSCSLRAYGANQSESLSIEDVKVKFDQLQKQKWPKALLQGK